MTSSDNSVSYRVGDVTGTGIVIGNHSSSSVITGQTLSPMQIELSRKLEEFIDLLASHESSVQDAPDVRQSLLKVQREVGVAEPRWGTVRKRLSGIAASVGGVAALTEAMNNILALLGRIPR